MTTFSNYVCVIALLYVDLPAFDIEIHLHKVCCRQRRVLWLYGVLTSVTSILSDTIMDVEEPCTQYGACISSNKSILPTLMSSPASVYSKSSTSFN